jgi:AraC-like DNA-binding protein
MQQLVVPSALVPFVRTMRVVADTPAGAQYRRLPDCEVELLVDFGAEHTAATLVGTRTTLLAKPAKERGSALLVRFRVAGASAFFRGPMSELTDQLLPLEVLWGRPAHDALARARDAESAAEITTGALQQMLQTAEARESASVPAIRRALRAVRRAEVLPRVAALAAEIGLSERQLRRGFDSVIGVSPKRFLRIVRFRRALRSARQSLQPDWAAIAEQHGYFDQAHLIADFREMTGLTPRVFVG